MRDGARREIPWQAHDVEALAPEARTIVGESWRLRGNQEHLAVGAFAILAYELAEVGCDAVVLSLITRAASDEVRHAEVCRKLAMPMLPTGAVPERVRGVPSIPKHEARAARDRTLLHVVEMCALNETFTGVYLTEMFDRATNPTARAAIESLLEDEIDHGRVGWAYLSSCVREGWGAEVVRDALPQILERAVGPVVRVRAGDRCTQRDDAALEAYGWLSPQAGAALYRRALHDVIFPGFDALLVDVRTARALASDQGW